MECQYAKLISNFVYYIRRYNNNNKDQILRKIKIQSKCDDDILDFFGYLFTYLNLIYRIYIMLFIISSIIYKFCILLSNLSHIIITVFIEWFFFIKKRDIIFNNNVKSLYNKNYILTIYLWRLKVRLILLFIKKINF